MKRIILYFILFSSGFASCKKVLDIDPTGNLTPETSYTSEAQIKAALAGIYQQLKSGVNYGQYYTAYYTAATDESYFYNATTPFAVFNNAANDNTTGNTGNVWRGCYTAINNANSLLDYIDVSAAGKVDPAIVRRAKGEALFLRGFYYFLLAQWYGDVPLLTHVLTDPLLSQTVRTPVKTVYDQVITDMTQADTLLQDQTYTTLHYTDRVTRTAVQGMLARVCLYAAGQPVNDTRRYADALAWAQKVVNSGEHSLMPDYARVFIDEAQNKYNAENMFEIGFNQLGTGTVSSAGGIGVYAGVALGNLGTAASPVYDSGYVEGFFKAHPRLYVSYEAGDFRRNWNFSNYTYTTASAAGNNSLITNTANYSIAGAGTKTPIVYGNTGQWQRGPAKWRREYEPAASRSMQRASSTNFPILRYADVLLMLAEAENEVNGPTAVAYNAINQVRRRSISASPIVEKIDLMTATGTGYNAPPPFTYTDGGGSGFSFNVVYSPSNKTVSILLTGQGSGFTSAPTITFLDTAWATGVDYNRIGAQVVAPNGRLYTVTAAGVATAAPTNSSGASNAAITGAVFTYAGIPASATVTLSAVPVVDLPSGLSQDDFRKAIQKERSRELCFEALRQADLKRWGILIPTIKSMALDINGTNPDYPEIHKINLEFTGTPEIAPLEPAKNVSFKDMFWPVPQHEIDLNKNITQNTGY